MSACVRPARVPSTRVASTRASRSTSAASRSRSLCSYVSAERDLEDQQHERRDRQVRQQQPPRHARHRRIEAEADAAHGLDPARVTELLAQRGDVDVERLRRSVPVLVPNLLEDLVAPVHGAGVAREQREQIELLRCQRELRVAERDPAGTPIDLELAGADRGRAPRPVVATRRRDRTDACHQLAETERLHHVVVGPELEEHDAIDFLGARGEHDDRDVRATAQRPAHIRAVAIREAEIQAARTRARARRARLRPWRRARRRSRHA